jgi:hypothetical protein
MCEEKESNGEREDEGKGKEERDENPEGKEETSIPICRHWINRGDCLYLREGFDFWSTFNNPFSRFIATPE